MKNFRFFVHKSTSERSLREIVIPRRRAFGLYAEYGRLTGISPAPVNRIANKPWAARHSWCARRGVFQETEIGNERSAES